MSSKVFPCPAAKKCGGCQLTNLSYEEQLSFKQGRAVKLLGKFGKVERILTTGEPFFYRNKVQAAFGRTRSGEIISGVYQSSTHNIVKVDKCYIEDERADAIIVTIRKMLKEFKLTVYNENNGTGFLRHVLVKTARGTGEVMVALVTGSREFKSKKAFCDALLNRHPEITTIIQNINNKFTSLVLGEEQYVLYGEGYITDILMGKRFIISPRSFYQINPAATVLLYETALKYADIRSTDTVIDAYAGVGTIGIICSDNAKKVISVELNPDAVKDARKNAKINGIKNMTFVCADATEFLFEMAKEGEKADVVVMDPPRAGSTVKFMKGVCAMKPQRVVYVSCNPETLARDLDFFVKNGYKVKKIQPVDMFPNTSHVETVVLMSRVDGK
ncbi:MAG: 23S rRNA (uracil(1939)-C(5))-methyltransferase RlmD [Clostridia bacterium]|nr:23S rRNA (uracil(1939)-C(5))-methyltransferase RlmD [Clostridia bacterium]